MMPSILAVGDTYLPVSLLRQEIQRHGTSYPTRFIDADPQATETLPNIKEYQGSPCDIVDELNDETVLLVHAAPVTEELLDLRPNLKVIACARGNPVNVDLEAAAVRGVTVLHTPAKNAPSVADLTMSFVHILLRKAMASSNWLREQALSGITELDSTFVGGQWMATEPQGHTIGLVGLGAIGQLVSDRAKMAGMRVLAYDPYVTNNADLVPFETLLDESDVISLHAKATPETEHILSTEALSHTKPGVHIINTARQSLLDEDALLSGLLANHVAGAALDVYEPAGRWPDLAIHPRVLLTPHIGGATAQTQERGIAMLLADLDRIFSGQSPRFAIVGKGAVS